MTKIPYPFPLLGGCYIEKLVYQHELNQVCIDFFCRNSGCSTHEKLVFFDVFSFLYRTGISLDEAPYYGSLDDIYESQSVAEFAYIPSLIEISNRPLFSHEIRRDYNILIDMDYYCLFIGAKRVQVNGVVHELTMYTPS